MDIPVVSEQNAATSQIWRGLALGDSAPGFDAVSHTGAEVCLEDYKEQAVWISFLRFAACPTCQHFMQRMVERYPHWIRDDFQILVVSPSGVGNTKQYIARDDHPFPVLCDPQREIFSKYGAVKASIFNMLGMRSMTAMVGSMTQGYKMGQVDAPMGGVPCDFLIKPGGKIAIAHYGKHIGDHIRFEQVEEFLGIQLP